MPDKDLKNNTHKPLTIAFHADGATAGGLAAFVRHLAGMFHVQGHEIVIFVNQLGPFSVEMSETYRVYSFEVPVVSSPGIQVGPVRFPNPLIAAKNLLDLSRNTTKVSRVLQQVAPDVVLGNGIASAAMLGPSCTSMKIPLVSCIHGIGKRGNDLFSMRARIAARFLNRADRVVGVSNTCQERFLPLLKVPSQTIYNCCPPVETTPGQKDDFLSKHGLAADTTLVGSFGRIMHSKGYHVLLDAFTRLTPAQQKNTALVIGGRPLNEVEEHYLSELKQQAELGGFSSRCFFIGETKPNDFFSLLDIFCHTYLGEENLSYAILEAMSAGCPIVAVDLGGPKEMIEHPKSGQLIPPNDPSLLANAISRYLDDPDYAKTAAQLSLERIQEKFNFEQWPKRWLELFHALSNSTH